MGHQSEIFRNGEGAAWLARNEHKLPLENDPIMAAVRENNIVYSSVLEIGCANGWRLYEFQDLQPEKIVFAHGIDPCLTQEVNDTNLKLIKGTADDLPFVDHSFDLVIYGFCLYLCDPEDYFKIASEGDRVLVPNGHIVIYDFHVQDPYARQYEHHPGVLSRKRDYSSLWNWSPLYQTVAHVRIGSGDDRTSVTILKKISETISVRR